MKIQKNNKIKIAISVIINAFESDGTSIRATRILRILKNHYNLSLITRADKKQELDGFEDVTVIIVKPRKTKLWNLKLIPIIIKNRFDIVYCSSDWFGFLGTILKSSDLLISTNGKENTLVTNSPLNHNYREVNHF
ncbi:hypothetical protein METP3_02906 [Methanosarcinales archaeon]|nr:hypothetical protein METP3_02906 [Methanosarcinales archaeon]